MVKANFLKAVPLCTAILALAGTENADDLRSQDDFKRGKKNANLSTVPSLSTSYIALIGSYHSAKILPNT